jgi:hypothetical protein
VVTPLYEQPEGATLERKSAAALKDLPALARATVALLNARGGHVIVGQHDDRTIEGVANAERERDRVQQYLLDSIEPPPVGVEVRIEEAAGRSVLIIDIAKRRGDRRLYAERAKGRYGFWQRSGAITRPLSYAEIAARLARTEDAPTDARPIVEDAADTTPRMVLRATWRPAIEITTAALSVVFAPEARRRVEGRDMGWDVLPNGPVPKPRARKLQLGAPGERMLLRFDLASGEIRFEGTREFLEWQRPEWMEKDAVFLFPYPLVEGTLSFARLVREVGAAVKDVESVELELALVTARGARLGPGRPDSIAWQIGRGWQPPLDETLLHVRHEVGDFASLEASPDLHAHALVSRVYEWFGYDEDAVPFWQAAQQRFAVS